MKTKAVIILLVVLCLATAHLHARTWTSSEGKTLEAEFVSAEDGKVTIKRADGRSFTLPLTKFSDADQDFVREKLAEMEAGKTVTAADLDLGDYTGRIKGEWVKAEHRKLPYQVFGPAELDKEARLPVVVYLHGTGERGSDNEKQIVEGPRSFVRESNFEKRPCIVIVPQCPEGEGWSGGLGDDVIDLIEDVLKEVSIADEDRVYITGYSMGSFGTWSILGQEPKLFAAAIPIAGGGNAGLARDLRKIPIWTFHGDKDESCSVADTRAIVAALEKAKAPVKYTEMKGEGHGIPGKVYNDVAVHEWLFAQKRE